MQFLETIRHLGATFFEPIALDLLPLAAYVCLTVILCLVLWRAFRKAR